MAQKSKTYYICSQCGYESAKWYGCCPGCGEWNTMNEEQRTPQQQKKSTPSASGGVFAQRINEISVDDEIRFHTGMTELDRVLGGGIVKGSLVLLSGDPGIGKSTILLQICEYLGQNLEILYVSGEESARQIKLRAKRLGVSTEKLSIMCQTDVEAIVEYIKAEKPQLVIVDSIQTMCVSEINSSPGSVTQVRESTNLYMHCAKSLGIPTIVVGHVNKDGNIAGPKVLEHIVDCVLYFEGERHLSYRILRAVKNRYGSTNEIGVFEMLDKGLVEVPNPSLMLISGKPKNTAGTCIACVMEGSRPILAEVQALAAKTSYSAPRRMVTGFDFNRLNIIIAVLEKRLGIYMSTLDVYLNIVGGFRLDEPAGDLPVALALYSGVMDKPIDEELIAFGEIGLGGEIRSVSHITQRIKEAERMGFKTCIVPKQSVSAVDPEEYSIDIVPVSTLKQAFSALK